MSQRTVLIVDDDPSIREVARMCLEVVAGWRVLTAQNGAEGLVQTAHHQPDAVLLDVMMPGMDGLTTFARIHETPETADIPVILLTAKARPGSRQDWEGLPVSGVISKPFDPMNLPRQIQQLLGWE